MRKPIQRSTRIGELKTRPLARAMALALILGAGAAGAADFLVVSDADAGPGTLRDAIAQANAAVGGDNIVFGEVGNIILTSGQIDVTDSLRIEGRSRGSVISGNDSSRIFSLTAPDASLILEDLILIDGRAEDTGGNGSCQAGTSDGGAVCVLGPLSLIRTRILDSVAVDGRGGAIHASTASSVQLLNSAITGNRASGRGGGMNITAGSQLRILKSRIEDNSTSSASAHGGGVYATATTVQITESSITGNFTEGQNGQGAGLWLRGNSEIALSTISGNFSLGLASRGAALHQREGNLSLRSTTITGNTATTSGAIAFNNGPGDDLVMTMVSTILAGNAAPAGNFDTIIDNGGSITVDMQASLFGDAPGEINGVAVANIFSDSAGLAPLADNDCFEFAGVGGLGVEPPSGCTWTHAILPGSAALNAGFNETDAFDQRGEGFPRVFGSAADIGAFESQGFLPGPISPPAQAIPTTSRSGAAIMAVLLGLMGMLGLSRSARPGF